MLLTSGWQPAIVSKYGGIQARLKNGKRLILKSRLSAVTVVRVAPPHNNQKIQLRRFEVAKKKKWEGFMVKKNHRRTDTRLSY